MKSNKLTLFIGICGMLFLVMSFVIYPAARKTGMTPGKETSLPISKIVPGMNSAEFRVSFPDLLPEDDSYSGNGYETVSYSAITGTWTYEFAKNSLVRASFNWYQVLQYDDLNEGKSNKATAIYRENYPSAHSILDMLTEKYGEPKEKSITDTTGMLISYDTYTTDMITAYWEKNDLTIRYRFWYDGRERPDPMQNNINGPGEMFSYRVSIEVMGTETEKKLHFQLGETAQEMEKRDATIFKNGTGLFGSFHKDASMGNLDGNWSFCFKNGVLQQASFQSNYWEDYEKDITETEYAKLIENYRSVVKELEKCLGKPVSAEDQIPEFKKFNERHVVGEDYLYYEWKEGNRTINLSLRHHFGGKGEYHHSMYFYVYIMDKNREYEICY